MISEYKSNNCKEYYITIEPTSMSLFFEEQFESLLSNYEKCCQAAGIDITSNIYIKIYLSDITNQIDLVKKYFDDKGIMYFVVGQAPASGRKVAIEAYHILPNEGRLQKCYRDKKLSYKHNHFVTHIGELVAEDTGIHSNSYDQTSEMFNCFMTELSKYNCTLSDNAERVWFYIRDIDNNYQGLVDARNNCFDENGLTSETHYIASTGIEGTYYIGSNLVLMNYKFTENLQPEQFHFMSAVDSLCPTYMYNVAFERGTKIIYGDCSQYYISGTASIDASGNILYENNVLKQTERAIDNIEALLEASGASLKDLKLMLIYLRDFSDYNFVNCYIKETFRDSIPYLILKAPVCRPGWLVEIEGIAINDYSNCKFPDFYQ